MSENLFNWHSEVMVALEMKELEREIEQIRLIKDAGLAKPGLFERIGISLGNTLVKAGKNLRERRMSPHQAYQTTSSKIAS